MGEPTYNTSSKNWPDTVRAHYSSRKVYYASQNAFGFNGELGRVNFDGTGQEAVWNPSPAGNVIGLAVDQTRDLVYFSSRSTIYSYSITTGNVTAVLLNVPAITFLALDETRNILYYAQQIPGDIYRCDLTNTTQPCTDILTENFGVATGMAYYNDNIWLVEKTSGTSAQIRYFPSGSVNPTPTLFLTIPFVNNKPGESGTYALTTDIFVDTQFVYFSCFLGCKGDINRVDATLASATSTDIHGMEVHQGANSFTFGETISTDACQVSPTPASPGEPGTPAHHIPNEAERQAIALPLLLISIISVSLFSF